MSQSSYPVHISSLHKETDMNGTSTDMHMLTQSQLVTVQNAQTVMDARELFNSIWAVKYQVSWQYGRSAWIRRGLAPSATIMQLPKGMKPPKGAWNIILMDHTDQAGALGWHSDDSGTNIPYGEVFCGTAKEYGMSVAEVLSHEVLEMLVDPYVEGVQPRVVLHDGRYWIVEVGDPVQGCGYDVGEPEGRPTGMIVADFAEPAWWLLPNAAAAAMGPFSYRSSVKKGFTLSPNGYMSTAPQNEPENWTQTYGSDEAGAKKAAERDSFISRINRLGQVK